MDEDIYNVFDAGYFRTLTHPLRLRVLAMLGERPSSPARLARTLGVRTNVVAYHVKRLHELGLAERVDVRRGRGGLEHFYSVPRPATLADEAWGALTPEERTAVLQTVLAQIGRYLSRAAAAGGFNRPEAHISRTPLRVDEQGWNELAEIARDCVRAADAVERGVAARGVEELFDAGLVLLLFEANPFSNRPAPDRGSR